MFDDIKVLTGLEAIRKRPSMYIGDINDPHCLTKLVIEAMCLSRASTASEISVFVRYGTEICIEDNSSGISMELVKTHGKTLVEILATQLHACKHLKHESVKNFCEIGIVVVNALSSYFYITNRTNGAKYSIWYKKGKLEEYTPFISDVSNSSGFGVVFKFDEEIFGTLKIDNNDLINEIEKIKLLTSATINLVFEN